MEIDRDETPQTLNEIVELELAGVVRFTQYSLMVFGHADPDHGLDARPGPASPRPRSGTRRLPVQSLSPSGTPNAGWAFTGGPKAT